MGKNHIEISGNITGSNVVINSKLEDVRLIAGQIPSADEDSKKELQSLIAQLSSTLERVPPEKHEEAEAVAETAKVLVDQAKAPQPNQTLLKSYGEAFKQAAKTLADIVPTLLPIVTQIATVVIKLTHP